MLGPEAVIIVQSAGGVIVALRVADRAFDIDRAGAQWRAERGAAEPARFAAVGDERDVAVIDVAHGGRERRIGAALADRQTRTGIEPPAGIAQIAGARGLVLERGAEHPSMTAAERGAIFERQIEARTVTIGERQRAGIV